MQSAFSNVGRQLNDFFSTPEGSDSCLLTSIQSNMKEKCLHFALGFLVPLFYKQIGQADIKIKLKETTQR